MRKNTAIFFVLIAVSFPFFLATACKNEGTEARYEYEIQAEYFPEERRLNGSMKVTVPNNTESVIEEIPFALYGNAFRVGADPAPVSELLSSA